MRGSAASPILRDRRILVVEDEFLVALDLEAVLKGFGCEVLGPHGSVDAALRAVAGEAVDAAILDVVLGGLPVCDVADELAARGIPFVFTTGYARLPAALARLPDATVIQKPYDPVQLRTALEQVLKNVSPRAPGGIWVDEPGAS